MVVFGFPNSFLHTTERDFFVGAMRVASHECRLHFAALHVVFSAPTTFLHCGCCHLPRGTETVCTLARVLGSILSILDVSGATGCKNDKAENRDTNLQCKQEKEDSQGPRKRR